MSAAVPGVVYLVGAGPGDPGLMTARALELIAAADVILHDKLIPPTATDGARADAIVEDVGKIGGGPQVAQTDTNQRLVDYAKQGKSIVRLKGGDPFVFGRGGEEALILREHGIDFEIVPGVTSGIAAPAYAGVPVTFRREASAVAFVTGHEDPAKPETQIDWPALAAFPGTLVFYMGVRQLERIAAKLIEGGRPATEPVAVVERGTLPGQRTILATLATVAADAKTHAIKAPAITLVGSVAALRDRLEWLERRPLYGATIGVTRARAQASAMAATLRALGAEVIEAPTIKTQALAPDLPDLDQYDLLAVTSPNGAHELVETLYRHGQDVRALANIATIAAIGPGTARALQERGIKPDVIPARSVAEGLLEALADIPVTHALIARAQEGRDTLQTGLLERGAKVDLLALYETVPEPLDDDTIAALRTADFVTFTSGSSVRFLLQAAGPDVLREPRVASIGPATSAELRAAGIEPDLEADPHTPDGLIETLRAALRTVEDDV